jgi:hypothetical protein
MDAISTRAGAALAVIVASGAFALVAGCSPKATGVPTGPSPEYEVPGLTDAGMPKTPKGPLGPVAAREQMPADAGVPLAR